MANIFRGFDYTTEEKSSIARKLAAERGISYKSARRSVERYTTETATQKRSGTKKALAEFEKASRPITQQRIKANPQKFGPYIRQKEGSSNQCREGGGTPIHFSLAKAFHTRQAAARAVDLYMEEDLVIEAGAGYHAPGIYKQTLSVTRNKAGRLTDQYRYPKRNSEWAVYYVICINSQ